jgi:hypothetical protein
MKYCLVIVASVFFFVSASPQDVSFMNNSRVSLGFRQIKESANIGLVFRGPDLRYEFHWDKPVNHGTISYENNLGFGVLYARHMTALDFYVKPLEFNYLYRKTEDRKFAFGPSVKLEYFYDYYPELQSGFDYWFTDFSLGLKAEQKLSMGESKLTMGLQVYFLGLVSRQPEYRDPYFYELGFGQAVKHLHSKMHAGTPGNFNTTEFEVRWTPSEDSRFTFIYSLEYAAYYDGPKVTYLNHQFSVLLSK